ncbi:tetratricopeptide repeat protein [Dongia deserti]|uniref:tetratricopeptide repeat protein n=1 Tax=Dongia deserti TaxID=2268030 RepID=UPI000E65067E|nr:tetratricopeptide repeat protein [Dongia deserti]
MRYALAILIAIFGLGLADAQSDQTDPRLKGLFEQLRTAQSPEAAAAIESQIWVIWSKTGDAELDQVLQIGSRAMAIGDTRTALKIFDTIVRKAPNFAEGWNKRATVHYMIGDYEASLADIDRTLELEPHHFGALAGLGLINVELERDEAALDAFERVLKVTPQSESAKQNIEFVKQRIKDKSI